MEYWIYMPYDVNLVVNGSVSFGFQASYIGTNSAPTVFTLNGSPCTSV